MFCLFLQACFCPDRNLVVFHHCRHYEGLRLLPSVCEQIIIQQTLTMWFKKYGAKVRTNENATMK